MNTDEVKNYFQQLQTKICKGLEDTAADGKKFSVDKWTHNNINGLSRVIEGDVFEKGGVNFSHVKGDKLPASASKIRSELSGASFEAMGVSLVIHPSNPFVPTTHLNVRFIQAFPKNMDKPIWWFGGGFDLTPYYPFDEDCLHWHRACKNLCAPYGDDVYKKYKDACDRYFYLPHRAETRGIGGLFFDDLNMWEFDKCFAFTKAVGEGFLDAYLPIVAKRKELTYTKAEKDFQLYRRGRYAEFNLIYDRGTHFGLQSGGRTESILMSLPPTANWVYNWSPEKGSKEAKLMDYLKPTDWLSKAEESALA